jgi:hypothetical protein
MPYAINRERRKPLLYPWVKAGVAKTPRFSRIAPYSVRCQWMVPRIRCAFCPELAVVFRLEKDGRRLPLCAFHMPVNGIDSPPAPDDRDQIDGDERPLR